MTVVKLRNFFQTRDLLSVLFPVISILVGLLGGALIIWIMGFNPFTAYKEIIFGSFGSKFGFFGAVLRFIPLAFGGLAVTIAFRGGVFNIGAEGQLYMGALLAAWVAVSFPNLPSPLLIPFALIAGAAAGGIWAMIPAVLKVTRGFNEILVTIFMNYIAIFGLGACVSTFLRAPDQSIVWTSRIPDASKLPRIPGTNIHIGVILIFVIAVLLWYLLNHRTLGYEIRAVGLNAEASRYGGVDTKKVIIITMLISGVIASFAGSVEILGVQHRLREGFLVNYGYTAIPIALLGGLNPYGTIIAAFVYGVLLNGASSMQVSMGVPVPVVHIIIALSILSAIGVNGLRKVLNR